MTPTELDILSRRFPVARGRAVKGLLQAQLAKIDETGKLVEKHAGRRRPPAAVTTKVHRDLVDHQRALIRQVDALLMHGMAVDADLAAVAGHLRRTQYVAAHAEELARNAHGAIEELSECLSDLAEFVGDLRDRLDRRIDALELRVAELEARVSLVEARHLADHALRRTVGAWQRRQTYAELPWGFQIVLLAQEVFAGPVGYCELLTDDKRHRNDLTDLLLDGGGPWPERMPTAALLDALTAQLGSGTRAGLLAEWLGAGLDPGLDGNRGPLVLALRDRLIAARQNSERDQGSATSSAEHGAADRPPGATGPAPGVPPSLDSAAFVRRVVAEQANTALSLRRASWPLDRGPIGPR